MPYPRGRAAAVALLCGALVPRAAVAEPLPMAGEARRALQRFDDGAERLAKARAAAAALETHDRPKGSARDWEGVLAAFEGAAEAARRSEGPAVPDAADYKAPPEQLRSCATRQAALTRIERWLKTLHAAGQRCSETRVVLRERLAAAQAAEEGRKSLLKSAARLSGDPLLAAYFPWRWDDLEKRLAPAIATYAGELRRWQERVDRGSAELRQRAAALAASLDEYAKARDCVLAGQWAGMKSQGGAMGGILLRLAGSGTSWSGTASIDGVDAPIHGVKVSGNTVQIAVGNRRTSLNGSISDDGRSIKGTFFSADGPGTFTLRKQ